MPLYSQITRNGEAIPLRWGWWHVECMCAAADIDGIDLWRTGTHVVSEGATFTDPADGEVLTLLPGDVLTLHR